MSSVPITKKNRAGNEGLRRAVERHIEELKRSIVDCERFLEDLDRGPDARDLEVLKLLYPEGREALDLSTASRPYEAIKMFLEYVGEPQPRWVISRALILARAPLGKFAEKSIDQSISTNVTNGKFAEPNPLRDKRGPSEKSMVGLPEFFKKK